jgi:F0F1-type ATP synthase assembly protein I
MSDPEPSPKESPIHQYAVYSNLAFEMGAVIALGVFGGIKLDSLLNISPLFTILCSLASIAVAMFLVIRSLTKPHNKAKHEQKNTH